MGRTKNYYNKIKKTASHSLVRALYEGSSFRAQFHQRSTYSFYARRSQKRKKDSQVVNLFYTFGIYERNSCT